MTASFTRFRGSLTLLAVLFVVMFVGAAVTGGFYASEDGPVAAASEAEALGAASRVAQSGLELALAMTRPADVSALPEGADTVLFKADTRTLDGVEGSFEVRLVRASATRAVLASTAALHTEPSGRCTARVTWELDGPRPPPPAAAVAPCVADPDGGNP